MCGIVGLFIKDNALEEKLGELLCQMLVSMTDRGPDSAGMAIYPQENIGKSKVTVQSYDPHSSFNLLEKELRNALKIEVIIYINNNHAIIEVNSEYTSLLLQTLKELRPEIRIMSKGDCLEIYKEVGRPETVTTRFNLSKMSGSHGIGHTRMATESAITTMGAHPFNTGKDQCLVHNGSLSNHNSLRRRLITEGLNFETDNDTEVGAAYLTWKINTGNSVAAALETAINDLDGFYTFVVGTKNGFAVLRDPIGCKPAVMAETDQYVAFGSEFRALVGLPKIKEAHVWEPEPATVYFWDR